MTTTVNGIDELREPGPDRRPERLARGDPRAHRQVRRGLRRPPVDPRRRGARQDRQPIRADDRAREPDARWSTASATSCFAPPASRWGELRLEQGRFPPRCPAAAASGPASRPCRWMRWAADGTSWSRSGRWSSRAARSRSAWRSRWCACWPEAPLGGGLSSKEWPLRPSRTASGSSAWALPDGPGVYIFRNEKGKVLYVGKARAIRKRVAGHFSKPGARGAGDMVAQIHDIEFIVTETEAEALLAEQEFIKRYRPVFNVRLRDDKSYPYIGISLDEDFPRMYFTRERTDATGRTSGRSRTPSGCARRSTCSARSSSTAPATARARASQRQPLPRLPHQALPGALRGLHLEGGVPRERRDDHRLPLRPLPADRARPRPGDEGRSRPSRSSSRPPSTATS